MQNRAAQQLCFYFFVLAWGCHGAPRPLSLNPALSLDERAGGDAATPKGGWHTLLLDPPPARYLVYSPSNCVGLPRAAARFADGHWLLATGEGSELVFWYWSGGSLFSLVRVRRLPSAEITALEPVACVNDAGASARCVMLTYNDGIANRRWRLRLWPTEALRNESARYSIFEAQLDGDAQEGDPTRAGSNDDIRATTDEVTDFPSVRARVEGNAVVFSARGDAGAWQGVRFVAPGVSSAVLSRDIAVAHVVTMVTPVVTVWTRATNGEAEVWRRLQWRREGLTWRFAGNMSLPNLALHAAEETRLIGANDRCVWVARRTTRLIERQFVCPAGLPCEDHGTDPSGFAWCSDDRAINAAPDAAVAAARLVVHVGCVDGGH